LITSRIEKDEPILPNPKRDKDEPSLDKERMLTELPILANSKTDNEDPILVKP
jgi:hypothetical protein